MPAARRARRTPRPVSHSARSERRVCVSSTATSTSVVQMSQKSRSSRRSAHTSSTNTSGMPSTRYAASTTGLPERGRDARQAAVLTDDRRRHGMRLERELENADDRHRHGGQRHQARRAPREAGGHVAAHHEEEQEESGRGEVGHVTQPGHQVAGDEPGQHREEDEAHHRPVGRRAIEVEPVDGDLADQHERREQQAEALEGREVEAADLELEGRAEHRRHERGAQEDEREQQAEREPAVEQLDEGRDHQLQVDPEAAIADVENVVAQLVARVREVAAAELRQAGHARAAPRSAPRSSWISRIDVARNTGRIGRGPTMFMSPRTTFRSCGISSSLVRFRKRPTGV